MKSGRWSRSSPRATTVIAFLLALVGVIALVVAAQAPGPTPQPSAARGRGQRHRNHTGINSVADPEGSSNQEEACTDRASSYWRRHHAQ